MTGNFLLQGSILAAASIIAKIIGMIYRIPLTNILGDRGNAYYSTANEVYSIILMVSSFSIPLAVSKLMSERIAKGEYRNAHRIFMMMMRVSVIAGGATALITYALAGVITNQMLSIEYAKYGLRVIAPAILIFAITGTFRGYFQAFGNMVPTAVSQLIEQVINAIVSILCAMKLYRYGMMLANEQGDPLLAPAWGAAGATFGTVVSVTAAMIIMMILYTLDRREFNRKMKDDMVSKREDMRAVYEVILRNIIPIVISTIINNITIIIDQGFFNATLLKQGFEEAQYNIIWGIYTGKYRILMNVALSLASCLGPAIIPNMRTLMAGNKEMTRALRREINDKIAQAVRFTMILTIPCAFGLAALGGPIIEMLFHPTTGLPLTIGIIQAGTPMIIFFAYSALSTAVLQGLDKLRQPVYNLLIALGIHIVLLIYMLRSMKLNIYAVVYSNTIFALIVCLLNALCIARAMRYRQETVRTFLIPLVSSAIMAFAAFCIYRLFHLLFPVTFSVIVAILAGVVVYGLGLVAFRGVSREEVARLPKGNLLLKLIAKTGLWR